MLRCVALAFSLCLPALSWAFGLGEITVNSALNEPLDARIKVHSLRGGEVDELRVRLADDEAFRTLGLEKTGFLRGVKAEVLAGTRDDEAVILLSSRQAAREPFLSVVLEVRGLNSRVLREYTVLLDPSSTASDDAAEEPATAVAAQEPAQPAPTPVPAPTPAATPAPSPAEPPRQAETTEPVLRAESGESPRPARPGQPVRGDNERRVPVPQPETFQGERPAAEEPSPVARDVTPVPKPTPGEVVFDEPAQDGDTYGPVKAGETLWSIARAVRPDERVTMDQVMWALYASNPEQFNGNLNLVKEGAVLGVPSRQAMINVSPAEAGALVADEAAAHRELRARGQRAPATPAPEATETVQVQPAPTPRPTPRATPRPTPAATPAPTPRPTPRPTPDTAAQPEDDELPALPADDDADTAAADLPALPQEPEEDAASEPGVPEADVDEEEAALARLRELAGDYGDEDSGEDEAAAATGPDGGADELPALPADPPADRGIGTPGGDGELADSGFNPLWLLALLVIILAGAAVFVMRRRRASAGEPAEDQQPTRTMESVTTAAAPAAAATAAAGATDGDAETWVGERQEDHADDQTKTGFSDTDVDETSAFAQTDVDRTSAFGKTARFQSETQDHKTEVFQAPPASEAPRDDEVAAADSSDTLDLGSDTVSIDLNEDPVSEADFHLAYGLYDEAALLLNQAIENEPERQDLHEKLAETHFAAGNADEFLAAAQALKAKNPDNATWQRVVIMGQQLSPDAELFEGEVAGGGVDIGLDDEGDSGLDLDFGGDDAGDSEQTTGADEDAGLEFSLDEPEGEPAEAPQAERKPADDDNLVEFEPTLEPASDSGQDQTARDEGDSGEFDLDTDFGDFDFDEKDLSGDEELPDLDEDFDFGDLERELEDEQAPGGDDAGADKTAGAAPESGADSDAADQPGMSTDFDLDELAEDTPTPEERQDAQPSGMSTDFDLEDVRDAGDAPEDAGDSDLTGMSTDFDLDMPDDDDDSPAQPGQQAERKDYSPLDDLDVDNLELEPLEDQPEDETELGGDTTLTDQDQAELTAELSDEALDDLDLGSDDSDAIGDGDEIGTKLDLARAYVDMGESDMARGLLKEVAKAGNGEQKAEAKSLLDRLG